MSGSGVSRVSGMNLAKTSCNSVVIAGRSASTAGRMVMRVMSAAGQRPILYPDIQDVTISDDVLRPLDAHLAGVLGALLAAAGDEVLVGDRLGADEAPFEVGMDDARRLRRL